MTEALYQRQGNLFTPTEAAGSPWHPGLLHGGSVSGLLGFVAREWLDSAPGFFVNRLTIDLLRPVPKAPLRVAVEPVRDGRRLKLVDIRIHAGEQLVCRASALAQRQGKVVLPDYAPRPDAPPVGPHQLDASSVQEKLDARGVNLPPGLHSRVELREVTPWNQTGKGTSWVRIPVTIVEGVPLSPLTRAALVSDLGNGAGQLYLGNGVGSINADITLSLFRYPVSEWICFQSEAQMPETGIGVVHTRLYDEESAIGHVVQTVQANVEYSE